MPQIYQFVFPGESRFNKWGWHEAHELDTAANNAAGAWKCQKLHPGHIGWWFSGLHPMKDGGMYMIIDGEPKYLTPQDIDGEDRWLEYALRTWAYVPARVGTQLIRLINKK